jgi:hypothetical protein
MEDALKKLDTLTNEEARMATAQVLKATHMVENKVLDVDNRVAGVDDRVVSVGEKVKAVNDKVAVAIDGAQPSSVCHQDYLFNFNVRRGKTGKGSHGSSETFVTHMH